MIVIGRPLLGIPFTVTTTAPLVAPDGTVAVIEDELQPLMVVAFVPLNETAPEPWVEPKLAPEIVTVPPTAAVVGVMPVTIGACETVNGTPLLETPSTVTTTFPMLAPLGTATSIDVSPHIVGLPATPLNVTVPGREPKPVPEITTVVPTGPEVGERVVMPGVRVSVVEPFTVPTAAWMVVSPSSRPVAKPADEILATVVAEDVHVALAVRLLLLPSEKVPVAVNCTVAPTGKDAFGGVSEIDVSAITFWVSTDDELLT